MLQSEVLIRELAAVYQVCVALLIRLMIPVLVFSAAKLYDRDVWIPPRVLVEQVAKKQFLPLILGMILVIWRRSIRKN